jgi:hypothetical protein
VQANAVNAIRATLIAKSRAKPLSVSVVSGQWGKRASHGGHRGHRGHRGGIKIGGEKTAVNIGGFQCESEDNVARRPDTGTATTGGSRSPNGRKPRGKSRSRDSTKPFRLGIRWHFRTLRPN